MQMKQDICYHRAVSRNFRALPEFRQINIDGYRFGRDENNKLVIIKHDIPF